MGLSVAMARQVCSLPYYKLRIGGKNITEKKTVQFWFVTLMGNFVRDKDRILVYESKFSLHFPRLQQRVNQNSP
jgi:hypothetical protein